MDEQPIVTGVHYSVEPAADLEHVALVVEIDMIGFMREVIPDGQLAGQMGHRQHEYTNTQRFDMHRTAARALQRELGRVLDEQAMDRRGARLDPEPSADPPALAAGEVRVTAALLAATLSTVPTDFELVIYDPRLDRRLWCGAVRVYPGRIELVGVYR